MSYFDAGREEPVKGGNDEVEQPNESGWDVFADFNNAGPRYSHAFGLGQNEPTYVKRSSLLDFFAYIISPQAISSSHHPVRPNWTKKPPQRHLSNW